MGTLIPGRSGGSLPEDITTVKGPIEHVKLSAPGGAPGISNVNWPTYTLPDGNYEILLVWWVLKGAGTSGDTVYLHVGGIGDVTDSINISSKADKSCFVATTINDSYVEIQGSTNTLYGAFLTSSGNDCPPFDMHVLLRRTGDE